MGIGFFDLQPGHRGHAAQEKFAIAGVELAKPREATNDEVSLGLGNIHSVHGSAEYGGGVHGVTGLLTDQLHEHLADLGCVRR